MLKNFLSNEKISKRPYQKSDIHFIGTLKKNCFKIMNFNFKKYMILCWIFQIFDVKY